MLDVSDIWQIEVIAELGSISKAAEYLNVSQPTLSKRLSRLEHVLQIPLFHRSTTGMLPTQAASYLIESGRPLMATLKSIERHIEMMNGLETGELHLGVGPIVEQLFLPEVLLRLSELAPSAKIAIRTESAEELLSMLCDGVLDLIVGPLDASSVPANLVVKAVVEEEIVIVARQGHPLSKKTGIVSSKQLRRYPSIAPHVPESISRPEPGLGQLFSQGIYCDNYSTCKALVAKSDHVTGGPASIFHRELEGGELVRLPIKTNVLWRASCVARPEAALLPMVRQVMRLFVAAGKAT